MKILVCIRRGRDGEINPFDACAYEAALKIPNAEITLLSMGPKGVEEFLLNLTRLGAKKGILLCDSAFAGADTLATAYTLSLAVKKINPDLIFCGRQTLEGDTAQTGPMLSVMCQYQLITNVMELKLKGDEITCKTRDEGEKTAKAPALLTIERVGSLRLPGLRSRLAETEVWDAEKLGADKNRCGLKGSPTRVIETHENEAGQRKCLFIPPEKLSWAIKEGLSRSNQRIAPQKVSEKKLSRVLIIGESPRSFAETISDDISVLPVGEARQLCEDIKKYSPTAVLFGSDSPSKRLAAQVSAMMGLGLCADCTSLETDGETLFMIRPALSGSVIARIKSLSIPAMATVRTTEGNVPDIIIAAGYGARGNVEQIAEFAKKNCAGIATSRKMVDNGIMPYSEQVGLTGKMVSPPVYIAAGISGAVHHIVGMRRAGTIIAINPDKNAPIFKYADYGIVADIGDVLQINN